MKDKICFCNTCGVRLTKRNWREYHKKYKQYFCHECFRAKQRAWERKKRATDPELQAKRKAVVKHRIRITVECSACHATSNIRPLVDSKKGNLGRVMAHLPCPKCGVVALRSLHCNRGHLLTPERHCNTCRNEKRKDMRHAEGRFSNKRFIAFNGERNTISEWARRCNLSPRGIADRIRRGLPLEQVLRRGKNPRFTVLRYIPASGGVIDEDRQWHIYSLSDPRTKKVRYVGWSTNPKYRVSAHLSAARHGRDGNIHKINWLKQLMSMGLKPLLSILESGIGVKRQAAEKKWIALYRLREGVALLNLADGGDGTPRRSHWRAAT